MSFLIKNFIIACTITLLSLLLINKSYASVLFQDKFNGSGDLQTYNNTYKQITDFDPGNTFKLNSDHVETLGMDPAIIYTGTPNDNICASIDFNWSGNSPAGGWTNIMLHSTPSTWGYALQVRNDDGTESWVLYKNTPGSTLTGPISFDRTKTHTLKACTDGIVITGYLDNIQFMTSSESAYSGGYVGFASQTPTTYLDNFTIETSQTSDLDVPLLKQTSNPWQAQEYDSAHLWNPSDITINSWGCALTSAVMILQYYGIYTMPGTNFMPFTPGTLNDWLKSQPDGYVNTGWVNWLALSRFSKLAANYLGILPFDALEYKRISSADTTQLTNDLNNNIPDILEEPGHFIAAKGISGSTYDINDPYFNFTSLDNTRYNNSFLSMGEFVPSKTDLSYIMITTDPNTSLIVKDQQGNIVGSSFIQSPIVNPVDGVSTNSPIKIYYLPKPDTSRYTVTTTNTTALFQLTSYLYDENGNPKIQLIKGFGNNSFVISFDKANNNNSAITKIITYDSTIQDIINAQNLKLIDNGLATSLIEMLKNAQKQFEKNPVTTKTLVNNGIKSLDDHQNQTKIISPDIYTLLRNDFVNLADAL